MSEFPQDKKEPIFPINESDVELVVGQPAQRRCFWARLRGNRCAAGQERPKNACRKAIKFSLITFFIMATSLFFMGHHLHPHLPWKRHPIICVPVTDTTTTVELPLAKRFTRIGLHPSLTSGESHIIHSDDVKDGSVSITFELPKDSELTDDDDEAKLFVCHIAGPKFVGLGVHAKGEHKHGEHKKHREHKKDGEHQHPEHHGPKSVKTTIALPASEAGHPRGISFHGPFGWFRHHKFGCGCMKKRIRMAIAKAVREAKAEKEAALVDAE
jgi:hypothetical protein